MRRSDATREPLWRSRSARETDGKGARSRFEALKKGAPAPPVHLLTARRKLVHAHAHAAASTTRGTDSAACCSPSRSRRRLPRPLRPRAPRAAGFRRPSLPGLRLARLLPAHGCSRRWPAPRARPPVLASRSRAASFRGRCCPGLLAPQTPAGSRFLRRRHAGLTAAHRAAAFLARGWSGSCHAIRHADRACTEQTSRCCVSSCISL